MDFFDLILQINYIDCGIKCVMAPARVLDALWFNENESPRTSQKIQYFGLWMHENRHNHMILVTEHKKKIRTLTVLKTELTSSLIQVLMDAAMDMKKMRAA